MVTKNFMICITLIVSNVHAAEQDTSGKSLTKIIVDNDMGSSESREIPYVKQVKPKLRLNNMPPDIVQKVLIEAISGNPRHEGLLSTVCKSWNSMIHDALFTQYIITHNPSYYEDISHLKEQYKNSEAIKAEMTNDFLKTRLVQERHSVKLGCCMIPCLALTGAGVGLFIGVVGLPFDSLIMLAIPAGFGLGLATGIGIRLYYRCDCCMC